MIPTKNQIKEIKQAFDKKIKIEFIKETSKFKENGNDVYIRATNEFGKIIRGFYFKSVKDSIKDINDFMDYSYNTL